MTTRFGRAWPSSGQ